jgi:hypothetical protein
MRARRTATSLPGQVTSVVHTGGHDKSHVAHRGVGRQVAPLVWSHRDVLRDDPKVFVPE